MAGGQRRRGTGLVDRQRTGGDGVGGLRSHLRAGGQASRRQGIDGGEPGVQRPSKVGRRGPEKGRFHRHRRSTTADRGLADHRHRPGSRSRGPPPLPRLPNGRPRRPGGGGAHPARIDPDGHPPHPGRCRPGPLVPRRRHRHGHQGSRPPTNPPWPPSDPSSPSKPGCAASPQHPPSSSRSPPTTGVSWPTSPLATASPRQHGPSAPRNARHTATSCAPARHSASPRPPRPQPSSAPAHSAPATMHSAPVDELILGNALRRAGKTEQRRCDEKLAGIWGMPVRSNPPPSCHRLGVTRSVRPAAGGR